MSDLNPIPTRALSDNFTKQTLQRSLMAKKRLEQKRRLKGLFTMPKLEFLKHPVGALIAIALIVTGGTGVYATLNWFNGNIKVTSDNSIMTVDLSGCKNGLPLGGINGSDPKNVQFKIIGTPHIEAGVLQQKLLAQCEVDAAVEFIKAQHPDTIFGYQTSKIKAIDAYSITLETAWGTKQTDRKFDISPSTTIFNQTAPAKTDDLKVGDSVVYTYIVPTNVMTEGQDIPESIRSVQSIFKTQYDTAQSILITKAFYDESNIMPLEMYNQLNK